MQHQADLNDTDTGFELLGYNMAEGTLEVLGNWTLRHRLQMNRDVIHDSYNTGAGKTHMRVGVEQVKRTSF